MILVDASVWIEHLRSGADRLVAALESGTVLMHPLILGELACGNIRNRQEVLALLTRLPMAPEATHAEAMIFIEERALMGKGVGFLDVHLLASVALAGTARLWTLDRRLQTVATELRLAVAEFV